MRLNYLLALGARFDLFINLDGFNEVALPPAENIPKGVFLFFPRKLVCESPQFIRPGDAIDGRRN